MSRIPGVKSPSRPEPPKVPLALIKGYLKLHAKLSKIRAVFNALVIDGDPWAFLGLLGIRNWFPIKHKPQTNHHITTQTAFGSMDGYAVLTGGRPVKTAYRYKATAPHTEEEMEAFNAAIEAAYREEDPMVEALRNATPVVMGMQVDPGPPPVPIDASEMDALIQADLQTTLQGNLVEVTGEELTAYQAGRCSSCGGYLDALHETSFFVRSCTSTVCTVRYVSIGTAGKVYRHPKE